MPEEITERNISDHLQGTSLEGGERWDRDPLFFVLNILVLFLKDYYILPWYKLIKARILSIMLLQTNERIEKWDKQMKILICLGEGTVNFFPL